MIELLFLGPFDPLTSLNVKQKNPVSSRVESVFVCAASIEQQETILDQANRVIRIGCCNNRYFRKFFLAQLWIVLEVFELADLVVLPEHEERLLYHKCGPNALHIKRRFNWLPFLEVCSIVEVEAFERVSLVVAEQQSLYKSPSGLNPRDVDTVGESV